MKETFEKANIDLIDLWNVTFRRLQEEPEWKIGVEIDSLLIFVMKLVAQMVYSQTAADFRLQ